MSFPTYEQYKESGASWLGLVPVGWRVAPLKSVARVINGFPFDAKLFDPAEGIPLVRIRDLNQSIPDARYKGEFVGAASIDNDDVLIGMDGDFNVGRWLGSVPALLNQRMCCVRADSPLVTRFLEYVLPTPLKLINDVTYATTVKHLSSFDVLKVSVAMPPSDLEISGVVVFLDRETAKIDALVKEQRHLIDLLKEKRQAVISQAVTKGLGPNAPMKDSGIEWVGKVPAHWSVTRLGYFATVENGTTPSRDTAAYWADGDVPWLASGEVNKLYIDAAEEFITQAALQQCSLRLLPAGTVIVGLIGQGKTRGMSALLQIDATINQNLAAICPGTQAVSAYFLHLFHAMYEWLREGGRGGNQAAMNCEMLRSLRIPVPGVAEQTEIASSIDSKLAEIDALRAEAELAMSLLGERRTALISAAVTGKIDVRGLVPQPEAIAA